MFTPRLRARSIRLTAPAEAPQKSAPLALICVQTQLTPVASAILMVSFTDSRIPACPLGSDELLY